MPLSQGARRPPPQLVFASASPRQAHQAARSPDATRRVATARSYFIIYFYSFSVLGAVFDMPLKTYLPTGLLLVPLLAVTNMLLFNIGWQFPTGCLIASLNNKGNPAPKPKE